MGLTMCHGSSLTPLLRPEEICDLIEKSLGSELDGTESSSVLDWAEDIGGS